MYCMCGLPRIMPVSAVSRCTADANAVSAQKKPNTVIDSIKENAADNMLSNAGTS